MSSQGDDQDGEPEVSEISTNMEELDELNASEYEDNTLGKRRRM